MSDEHPRPLPPAKRGRFRTCGECETEEMCMSYQDCEDAISEAGEISRGQPACSHWVAVADRLPAEDDKYLVHCPSADPDRPFIGIAWYEPESGYWSLLPEPWVGVISHWMELPGPPEPPAP